MTDNTRDTAPLGKSVEEVEGDSQNLNPANRTEDDGNRGGGLNAVGVIPLIGGAGMGGVAGVGSTNAGGSGAAVGAAALLTGGLRDDDDRDRRRSDDAGEDVSDSSQA